MKKTLAIILAVTALAVAHAPAQTATNSIPAADIAKLDGSINSLIPFVPAEYQPMLVHGIAIIGFLAMICRAVIGWRNNGLSGAFSGVFGGTNTPANVATQAGLSEVVSTIKSQMTPAYPPKGDAGLTQRGLIMLAICGAAICFAATGCETYEAVNTTSGSGGKINADVPIPFSGGESLLSLGIIIGSYQQGTIIQPTSTNGLASPSVAMKLGTKGSASASGQAITTSTNGTATIDAGGNNNTMILTGQAAETSTNGTLSTGH